MTKFIFARLGEPLVVTWPVKVEVPDDGGGTHTETFAAKFKIAPADRLTNLAQERPMTCHTDFLKEVFVGLGKDENQEWSETLRDQLVMEPYVQRGLNRAYAECSNGQAAVGNSEGPPAS